MKNILQKFLDPDGDLDHNKKIKSSVPHDIVKGQSWGFTSRSTARHMTLSTYPENFIQIHP